MLAEMIPRTGRHLSILLAAAALSLAGSARSVRAGPPLDNKTVAYLQRLSQTDQSNPQSLMALADWAGDNDLGIQAADLYRQVLKLNPADEHAYNRLVEISDKTRLSDDPQRQAELSKLLGPRFELHVSPHFLIFYDTDKAWALNRAVLLEKAHDLYFSALRRADIHALPLDRRLVCVLFDSHADFTAYSLQADGQDMGWSSGYYSQKTNRIAFYNDTSSPDHQRVVEHIEELQQTVDDLRQAITRDARNIALVSDHRRKLDDASRELQWNRNRLQVVANMINAAKTTHEAVHQLSFNSGVQTNGVMYPFWLSEGLATNFEVDDPARPFGPYFDNVERRRLLGDVASHNRALPLKEFVTLSRLPVDDKAKLADLYAQAYGLFQFLFKKRHDQMRQYLQQLSKIHPGRRSDASMLQEFEDAFGPVRDVQEQWSNYLRTLR
ncbi:MAG: DUF1570 domain-containing protein [Planctomycetes bacterium]|nr:DUF1570 domain-containing protein [Planctomycetota bacterium]